MFLKKMIISINPNRSYRWNYEMRHEIEKNPKINHEFPAVFKVRWYTAVKVTYGVDTFSSFFKKFGEKIGDR